MKNYCFTWNNYPEWAPKFLKDDLLHLCDYIVYGEEVAPMTGTKHLQGFIAFKKRMDMSKVIKMQAWHITAAKGTAEQNRTYCMKEGKGVELGTMPMTQKEQGEKGKEYWQNIFDLCASGAILGPENQWLYAKHLQVCDALIRKHPQKLANLPHTSKVGLWIWGPTGTGKSRYARTTYPDAYIKGLNKWWDGYLGQEVVILEDVDDSNNEHRWLDRLFKIWMDIYPFPAEIKGSQMFIRPKLFVVTSQYDPKDIFMDEKTLEAVTRRMNIKVMGETHAATSPTASFWTDQ